MEPTQHIQDCLMIKKRALTPVKVTPMGEEMLSCVSDDTLPGFCYDNALRACLALELEAIVYGVAIVGDNECKIPAEHAWLKDKGGNYFDTTYQVMQEHNPLINNVDYYSLYEFKIQDFLAFTQETLGRAAGLVGLEMLHLRLSEKHQHLFLG